MQPDENSFNLLVFCKASLGIYHSLTSPPPRVKKGLNILIWNSFPGILFDVIVELESWMRRSTLRSDEHVNLPLLGRDVR
jgi:hypothetical protein